MTDVRRFRIAGQTLALGLIVSACAVPSQQPPTGKKATLEKLDAASKTFTTATADFKKDLYTKIVNDHDMQDGITYVIHKGSSSEVGIKIAGKEGKTVQYKDGTVKIYNPGTNCVDTYSAAKNKSTADSFLGLSFGTSGKDLEANWVVTDNGSGTVSATVDGKSRSIAVEKLDLVPKDQTVKNNFTHVALWIDPTSTVAYKQIFYTPQGDTQTAVYTNVVLGAKPDTAKFAVSGKPCK